MAGIERGTPSGEPLPPQRKPTEQSSPPEQTQPQQGRSTGRESLQGLTTVDRSELLQRQQESQERQMLSGAWNLLEHRVKVYTPDPNRSFSERVRQKKAVNRWMEGLKKKGTDRDKLIIDLYTSITVQPGHGERVVRELIFGEFPQFRARVEPLSDEEIAAEIRKEEEVKHRKIEESLNTNRPLTLAQPKPIWEPPHPVTGTFS